MPFGSLGLVDKYTVMSLPCQFQGPYTKNGMVTLEIPSIQGFLGSPMVKTLCFHCRGLRFKPWRGNWDPACHAAWPKERKKKIPS